MRAATLPRSARAGRSRTDGATRTIRIGHEPGGRDSRPWVPGLIPGAYGEAPGADSALTHDWHDAWKSVEKLVTVERIAL